MPLADHLPFLLKIRDESDFFLPKKTFSYLLIVYFQLNSSYKHVCINENKIESSTATLTDIMCTSPEWANGLPLGVEIKAMARYGK